MQLPYLLNHPPPPSSQPPGTLQCLTQPACLSTSLKAGLLREVPQNAYPSLLAVDLSSALGLVLVHPSTHSIKWFSAEGALHSTDIWASLDCLSNSHALRTHTSKHLIARVWHNWEGSGECLCHEGGALKIRDSLFC